MLKNWCSSSLLMSVALMLTGAAVAQSVQTGLPFQNAALPIEQRVDDLVGRLTLEEKVSQMQNGAPAIPQLGIPAYDWWNEGLHGIARSGYATVFPQAIGMAATWDTGVLHAVGSTIANEARAKNNEALRQRIHSIYFGLTIWSPNINIFRDPRWGRGQETYGEDPYLTARLGVAFATGLQGSDPKYLETVSTPKHYAVHSGPESERHRFDVTPSPFDLEDTYLPAFRATITEAKADSIMCAYNDVDGVPACANTMLLKDTLRDAWHFNGYVTSDCGAIKDFYSKDGHHYSPDMEHAGAAAVLAGTDTNCGTDYLKLPQAVKDGLLPQSAVDTAVKRLFTARMRLGLFDPGSAVAYAQIPFSANDSAEHREFSLDVARKSMVLLKNEGGALPLSNAAKTIAVVGPNAASLLALEGNYNGVPSAPVLPIDGMEQEFGGRAKVVYAQGSPYAEGVALPVPRTQFHPAAGDPAQGLKGEYFGNVNFSGSAAFTRVDPQIDFDWNAASPGSGVPAKSFSVRWSGTLSAPAPGDYSFAVEFSNCYPCSDRESYTVFFDGKQVATNSTSDAKEYRPSETPPLTLHFADTKPHAIRIEYAHQSELFGAGITLKWKPPVEVLRDDAVRVAKSADAVVAFVGLNSELEGEEMPLHVPGFAGGDRTDIVLPEPQQRLLEAVAATGKPLIVVLMNGSALAVPWAQGHAAAILEAWYPGEAGGRAIAETLAGKNNPAGRLPVTFYASVDQLPPFTEYSMKNRTYRYFKGKPLYGFGYGLSYTHFSYADLKIDHAAVRAGDSVTAEVTIRNEGKLPGDEVAELYLSPSASLPGANPALKGFQRVHLAAGEAKQVRFELSPRDVSTVSEDGRRSVQSGKYTMFVGGGQPAEAAHQSAEFTVEGTAPLPK